MSNTSDILETARRVHFVGIGGIGMSALARLFLGAGKKVSGSDRSPSEITADLEKEGATFYSTQIAANITPDIELVVYTEAMPADHEELAAARSLGIRTINYFEALGLIANQYRLIAVSGSHGKTTTTAMLIDILERADLDPNAIVGSLRASTKSNYRRGEGSYFIAEACEYRRDFLSLTPDVLVITNIELEHVDYYKTLEDVQAAFGELIGQVRSGGVIVANMSEETVRRVVDEATRGRDLRVIDFTKYFDPLMSLTVPGLHNRLNAAAALAVADALDIPLSSAKAALAEFKNAWRRFEYKGEVNGAKIYDDYGHHPTEITATLRGAREMYPERKLTLVFQPHMFSRTHTLFSEFVEAFKHADRVYVLPIYAAREKNESGVTHHMLAEAVGEGRAHTQETFEDVVSDIAPTLSANDIVVVMGAGDVTKVASALVP